MLKVINGSTPAEIKNGLKVCTPLDESCLNCSYADWSFPNCTFQRNRDAYAYIEHLESAQPKWISVEERLPERHGQKCVGLYSQHGDDKPYPFPFVFTWYAYGDNGYVNGPHFSDEGLDGLKVHYWMPLPEPPKEG